MTNGNNGKVYDTLEAAKAAVSNPKYRVFTVEADGRSGFAVARTTFHARAVAAGAWGLVSAKVAEPKAPTRKSLAEQIAALSAEERAALLAQISEPKRPRRKAE